VQKQPEEENRTDAIRKKEDGFKETAVLQRKKKALPHRGGKKKEEQREGCRALKGNAGE